MSDVESSRLLAKLQLRRARALLTTRALILSWDSSDDVSKGLLLLWPFSWARYTITRTRVDDS